MLVWNSTESLGKPAFTRPPMSAACLFSSPPTFCSSHSTESSSPVLAVLCLDPLQQTQCHLVQDSLLMLRKTFSRTSMSGTLSSPDQEAAILNPMGGTRRPVVVAAVFPVCNRPWSIGPKQFCSVVRAMNCDAVALDAFACKNLVSLCSCV